VGVCQQINQAPPAKTVDETPVFSAFNEGMRV
jgi:hypothetical protein